MDESVASVLMNEFSKKAVELASAKAELAEAKAKLAEAKAKLAELEEENRKLRDAKPRGASTGHFQSAPPLPLGPCPTPCGHSQGVAAPPLPPGPRPAPREDSYASVATTAANIVPPKEPSSALERTHVEGTCCVDGCYYYVASQGQQCCDKHSKFTEEVSHFDEAPLCVECDHAKKRDPKGRQIRVAYALLPRGPRGRKAVFIDPDSTLCWTCSAKKEREERENQLKEEFGLSYVAPEERALWGAYRAPQPPNRLAEAVGTAFHAKE